MRWSYSRLSSFDNCKYAFYLNYIIANDEEYLSEGNYFAEVGSFVHQILAMIFENELSKEDAAQYFIDNYDDNVFYTTKKSTMNKTFEACANYFSESDFSWIDHYEILGVELQVDFDLDGNEFIAFIDLLLRDKKDQRIVVLDHKSAAYPFRQDGSVYKNSEHSFESYKKQMYLYCHAIKQKYGEFPKEITWNHFKENGRFATILFNQSEYEETMRWFANTIQSIYEEESFEPTLNYFYCKNLCNFRNSCEYCKTEWK